MSTYNEIGTGGATISSCAWIKFLDQLHTIWGAGDIVYNVDKAKRGVLEKVVIKKQTITRNIKTHGQYSVLYTDTFNALWNEWDLVTFAEAQLLSVIYLEQLLVELGKIEACR